MELGLSTEDYQSLIKKVSAQVKKEMEAELEAEENEDEENED